MDRRAAAALLAAAVAMACLLTGCGNDGLGLARQACGHVERSITLYRDAERNADIHQAAAERRRAVVQLEEALPLAARASSADGQWNPLMTTLQQIGASTEGRLIPALEAQCTQADSSTQAVPNGVPSGVGTSATQSSSSSSTTQPRQ